MMYLHRPEVAINVLTRPQDDDDDVCTHNPSHEDEGDHVMIYACHCSKAIQGSRRNVGGAL